MMLGTATAKVSLDASDFISNAAKVASASGQMEQAVSKSGGSLGDKILANAGNLTKFGLIMGGIGAGITGAFALGEKTAIGFGREMANVNSIAQLSQKQLDAVGRSVQDIAIATGKGPTDLAAGLYDVYSVGFQGADAMKILEISAKGANAGLTDTSTSAKVLTGTLNAFGQSGDQAQHYMDVLFQTVNDGAVSFEELSHNLANTAPLASTMGISIEELGSSYALMTKNGIPAAQAETQIAALMRAGINPTTDMTKALNSYGYESVSSLIAAKGFGGYLEFLNQASGGTAEGMSKLLGSSEAVNAALVLGKGNMKGYNEELKSMQNASKGAGATQAALDKQMQSTAFKLQKLHAAFDVFKIRMVAGFSGPLNFGIDGLRKFIETLANLPPGVQKIVATIGLLAGVLLTAGGAGLVAAVKVAEFAKVIKDLSGSTSAVSGALQLLGKPLTGLGKTLGLIQVGESGIATGPLLPWVAAAAVAVGAFYLAYKTNFLGIGDLTRSVAGTAKKFWNGFSSGFSDAHKNMNFFSAGLMGLARGIVTAFGGKDHMVTGFLGDMVNWLFNAASSVQKFGNYLKHAFDFGTQFKQLDQFGFIGRAFAASIGIPVAALGKLVQAYRQGGFIGMAKELPNFVGHMGDAFQAFDVGISRSIEALGRKFPGLAKITTPLAHAFDEAGKAGNAFIHSVGALMRGDFSGALKQATTGMKLLGRETLDLGKAGAAGIEKVADLLQKGVGKAFSSLKQQFPAFNGLWDRLNGILGNGAGIVKHLAAALGDLFSGNFSGMFRNLGSAAMDGLKLLGNAMGTIPSLIAGVFKSINWGSVGSALGKGLDAATGLAFQGLSAAGGAIAKGWDGLTGALKNFSWSGLGNALQTGLQQASTLAFSALNAAGGALSGAWDWIKNTASNIPWMDIANMITGGAAGAVAGLAGSLAGAAGDIWHWITEKVDNIDWTTIGTKLFNAGKDAAISIKNGIVDGANTVWDWLKGLANEIKSHLPANPLNWLKQTGSDIIQGLWNGLKSVWSSVESWFENALNTLIAFVNNAISAINKLSKITGIHIDPIPFVGALGQMQAGMDAAVKKSEALKKAQEALANAFRASSIAASKVLDAVFPPPKAGTPRTGGPGTSAAPSSQGGTNKVQPGVTPAVDTSGFDKIAAAMNNEITASNNLQASLSKTSDGTSYVTWRTLALAQAYQTVFNGTYYATQALQAAIAPTQSLSVATTRLIGSLNLGILGAASGAIKSVITSLGGLPLAFGDVGTAAQVGLGPVPALLTSVAGAAVNAAVPAFNAILGGATAAFGGIPPITAANFGGMLGSVSANSAAANAVASAETAGMAANVGANASNMASSAISSALNMQSGVEGAVIGAASTVAIQTAIAAATAEANASRMGSAGRTGGLSYASGIQSGMGLAIASAAVGAAGVAAALGPQDLSGAGFSTGASFSSGIASGILSNLGAIQAAASQVVSAAAAASAATAMIHSPSRLFARDIGEPITLGTAMGMTSKRSMLAIQSAGRSVINATRGIMAPVVSPRMAVAGRASGGSVVVNNNQQLHIQQNPGEDMNAFATRVIEVLTESGRSIA